MESKFLETSLSRAAAQYLPEGKDAVKEDDLFPDSVVAPFIAAVKAAPPQPAAGKSPSPVFTLEESKSLILAALGEFSPALGQKARDVFNDGFDKAVAASRKDGFKVHWDNVADPDSRWRIEQVRAGKCKMMRSRAAGSTPTAFDPGNPGVKAVIDYQFDSTLDTVVYLAHELGHSIADDNLQKGGTYKAGDNKGHMQETQAYYVQNIFYGYLQKHAAELEKNHAGFSAALKTHLHETLEPNISLLREENVARLHSRPMGILAARGVYNVAEKAAPEEREKITSAIMLENAPTDIVDVLATAGIRNAAQIEGFAQSAVASAVAQRPAPAPKAAAPKL